MIRIKIKKRGYSLLETVVYVGILAVIVVLVIGSILSVYQSFAKTRVERKLSSNGEIALERMVREIRLGVLADLAGSVLGAHPGALKIGQRKFYLSGNTLATQYASEPAENLTASDVKVTNLVFYRATSTNSELIKIELGLEAGAGIFKKSRNFYGSAVMRGSY